MEAPSTGCLKRQAHTATTSPATAVAPDYSFTVDIVDEPGSISTLAVLLASKGINIKNIGINHSREEGEGALRISFYNQDSETRAYELLKKYNYTLIK